MSAVAADLSSVVIRGSSVYAAPELFPIYRKQLGRAIDQTAARAIVDALIAKYEGDGYSRPHVRVDDALVSIGVLRVDVFEPRIAEVSIKGDPGPHRARLEELGSQLRAERPMTQAGMQAILRRMRELPGLSLSASTARDETNPNEYLLDVDTQFERVSGAVRLTNRGTDEAGPHFLLGHVVANGLLGGQTSVGAMFGAATDYGEYHGLGLVASLGLGEAGTRLSFNGFRSRSDPDELIDRDDLYGRDRVTVGFSRPLARIARASANLTAALDLDDLEITRGALELRDERIRSLQVGANWRWRHGTASQYAMSIDAVKGLDAFGSGLTALDLGEDPRRADFALLRASAAWLARVGENWTVRVDAFAQQSADVLPYGERFKIGGDRIGRGFEVTEIAGDQGLGGKVEARRHLPNAPAFLGFASLYGFYDIGGAWKHDLPGRESAATGGVGLSTQNGPILGSLELARPLTHADVEGHKNVVLFAEIAVSF